MKILILTLLFCFQVNAEYTTKVWLTPKSQQIQVTNIETRSTIIVYLEYDALKTYLRTYEVTKAGNYDSVLSEISGPESMRALIPMIDNVEYVSRTHERFGELDENFQSYSVYGSYGRVPKPDFKTERDLDIYFIKRILTKLFEGDNFARAKNVSSCGEYL